MTKKEIIETIELLSKDQGFYSGLYKFINEKSEDSEEFLQILEDKNFKDPVDLILYFEQ